MNLWRKLKTHVSILRDNFSTNQRIGVEEFWTWFSDRHDTFLNSILDNHNTEYWVHAPLRKQLRKLRKGIGYSLCVTKGGTVELVINSSVSIEGDLVHISFIQDLVSAAPKIRRWKFFALQPALGVDAGDVIIGEYTLNKDSLFFDVVPEGSNRNPLVQIFVKGYSDVDAQDSVLVDILFEGITRYLARLIGEFKLLTVLYNYEIKPQGELLSSTAKSIGELVEFVDQLSHNQKIIFARKMPSRPSPFWQALEIKDEVEWTYMSRYNSALFDWSFKEHLPYVGWVGLTADSTYFSMEEKKYLDQISVRRKIVVSVLASQLNCEILGEQFIRQIPSVEFVCKDFRKVSRALDVALVDYQLGVDWSLSIDIDPTWELAMAHNDNTLDILSDQEFEIRRIVE